MKTETLDSILAEFDFDPDSEAPDAEIVLPIRVSLECKKKYDKLQKDSKRKFVRTLKRVVAASVERAFTEKRLVLDQ